MGDLPEGGEGPAWVRHRHFVDEDPDGIALGDKRVHETLPHLVETLLKGFVGRSSRGSIVDRNLRALASYRAVGHVRTVLEGTSLLTQARTS